MRSFSGVNLNQKGFTFIEIMIATGLLALVIVGIVGTNILIQKTSQVGYEHTLALQDGNRAMEQLRSQASVGNFPDCVTSVYPNHQDIAAFNNLNLRNETVHVDYTDPAATLLEPTITVSWLSSQGRNETVTVRSLIVQRATA